MRQLGIGKKVFLLRQRKAPIGYEDVWCAEQNPKPQKFCAQRDYAGHKTAKSRRILVRTEK